MEPMLPVVPGFVLDVTTYAKDQPEHNALPCHRQPDGTVTIRWKLSWRERLAVLSGGSIWHTVLTFNEPLQPVKLETSCPISGHAMGDEEL